MIGRCVLDEFDVPCLVVRIVPFLFHIEALPPAALLEELIGLTAAQARANGFDAALYLAADHWFLVPVEGPAGWLSRPPFPDLNDPRADAQFGRLHTAAGLEPTEELEQGRARLRARIAGYPAWRNAILDARGLPRPEGYLLGDPWRGGREATGEELIALRGSDDDGVPRGLSPCPACGEQCGWCLDPRDEYRGLIVPVHCECANDNRCARCGELFHPRRLNSNYFDPTDGRVWHVPGFYALEHDCQRVAAGTAPASRLRIERLDREDEG